MPPHSRTRSNLRSVATLVCAALMLGGMAEQAAAQTPSIMSPGDTIVTGFPGVTTPTPPFPSGNPIDETFIDVNGPSMQIQRPQPDGPPAGQLIASPTVFSAPAGAVGEVFPITLDDQPAPNIYLGATSAFGIQIVAPDNDGDGRPQRITHGQPDATFMDGQWGQGGAPGSIYRVDGTTGDITLFTTIGANAGPGLGDIVYDRTSRQFFVSDLDTGLIYRLDSTGLIIDTFDHGVNGRPNQGLAPVADDNSTMDIAARRSIRRTRRAGASPSRNGAWAAWPSTAGGCTTPSPSRCRSGPSASISTAASPTMRAGSSMSRGWPATIRSPT